MSGKYPRLISRLLITLIILLGCAFLALAADRFPVELQDQFRRTVRIPREPRRIVSCSPGATEVLFALSRGDRLVGVTDWCNYPPEAKAVAKIGDLTPLNVERVASLHPDLVVAHELNGAEAVDKLSALGLAVVVLKPTSFADILSAIGLVGRATGRVTEAATLVRRLQGTMDRVRVRGTRTARRGLKVFILLGWDPFWTAGPGSYLDEAVTLAGGMNIARDLGAAWGQMGLESIVKRNPHVIITDIDPAKVYADAAWRGVEAIRKKQVFQIVGDEYYRPGPRLIEALTDLAELLERSR